MTEIAHTIDLKLRERLKDRVFRQRFFIAETSAQIAAQLVTLRKKRKLTQQEEADLLHTGQPAISRVERADYHNWSFNTLRRLAEALDARLRVSIEPAEDVLHEYDEQEDRPLSEPELPANEQDAQSQLAALSSRQKSTRKSLLEEKPKKGQPHGAESDRYMPRRFAYDDNEKGRSALSP